MGIPGMTAQAARDSAERLLGLLRRTPSLTRAEHARVEREVEAATRLLEEALELADDLAPPLTLAEIAAADAAELAMLMGGSPSIPDV